MQAVPAGSRACTEAERPFTEKGDFSVDEVLLEEDEEQTLESEEEHVLHFWQPFHFITPEGYDYRRNFILYRIESLLLRSFAAFILEGLNRVLFGFRITGRENLKAIRGGAITVCNHIHAMDCTMVNLALLDKRVYYLTLETNFQIPIVRHLIRVLGAVPVPSKKHCFNEMFTEMSAAARSGAFVHVYPEGVLIPYSKKLRRFKGGAFRLAAAANVPVLPMVLTQEKPSGLFSLYKSKPCLTLNILPPIYPDESIASEKQSAEVLRKACLHAMGEYFPHKQ